jgi:hypothetical protein
MCSAAAAQIVSLHSSHSFVTRQFVRQLPRHSTNRSVGSVADMFMGCMHGYLHSPWCFRTTNPLLCRSLILVLIRLEWGRQWAMVVLLLLYITCLLGCYPPEPRSRCNLTHCLLNKKIPIGATCLATCNFSPNYNQGCLTPLTR